MKNGKEQNFSRTEAAKKDLEIYRKIGDKQADELISHLVTTDNKHELYAVLSSKSWDSINSINFQDGLLRSYMLSGNELPSWAVQKDMKAASAIFRSNGNEFLFLLGIVSLPYCYAAAKGALSLYHTEKIRKNTESRLLDTTSFIVEIMKEDAFSGNGNGFLVVKQVRLRHALARFYLNKNPEIRNLNEIPINQEDMAGTNLAFSYIALKTLSRLGVHLSQKKKNAYLHFWAVISYLMGIDKQILPQNMHDAFWLAKKIEHRQFKRSEEGMELTELLLDHYRQNIPNKATIALIKPLMRHLLGDDVSKIIGIESRRKFFSFDATMNLLPLFKRFIFPPNQSFDTIVEQINIRSKQMSEA